MGARHSDTPANHTDLLSGSGRTCVFAVQAWSNLWDLISEPPFHYSMTRRQWLYCPALRCPVSQDNNSSENFLKQYSFWTLCHQTFHPSCDMIIRQFWQPFYIILVLHHSYLTLKISVVTINKLVQQWIPNSIFKCQMWIIIGETRTTKDYFIIFWIQSRYNKFCFYSISIEQFLLSSKYNKQNFQFL